MCKFCALLAMTSLLASYAPGTLPAVAMESSPEEHLVLGTAVSVRPGDRTIVIREANLFGQMRFQVRSSQLKQPSSLLGLRHGDRIMAVYSKKDGMLQRLRESRPSKNWASLNKYPL
jgi:hypothetical protein